jgi:hypothetical protein
MRAMHAIHEEAQASPGPSYTRKPTARQVHDDIESMFGPSPLPHTWSGRVGSSLKSGGHRAWRTMKSHPFASVVAVAIGATAVATVVGVVELTFGAAVAYAAYKVLREGELPLRAVQEVARELRV